MRKPLKEIAAKLKAIEARYISEGEKAMLDKPNRQNVLWYTKSSAGKMVLAKPDGTRKAIGAKPNNPMFSTRQAIEGWQRAVLFMNDQKHLTIY